jgi:hypothetical protein
VGVWDDADGSAAFLSGVDCDGWVGVDGQPVWVLRAVNQLEKEAENRGR